MVRMPRMTRAEIDDEIVDTAAALFARYGFAETPLQRVADAVGYSKTGLLHRFPSKEALQEAVLARWTERLGGLVAVLDGLPAGPERDRAAVTGLVDLALARPGAVALMLSGLTAGPGGGPERDIEPLLRTLGVVEGGDPARNVRVAAALAAIAVVAVAARDKETPDQLREHLVAASFDALGHPGRSED